MGENEMNKFVESEKDRKSKMDNLSVALEEQYRLKKEIADKNIEMAQLKSKLLDLNKFVTMAKSNLDKSEMDYWKAHREYKQAEREGR